MEEDSTSSISMYLSFESESTMSNAAYKTLTDVSGVSALETMDIENVDLESSHHINITLEADEPAAKAQPKLLFEKNFPDAPMAVGSPLRPLQLNILKEYKALCSTPTKEQLMRTVDVTRGSEALPCADLGLAFMAMVEDDKQPVTFTQPSVIVEEDNKENTQPESGDGSTMSSSVEIVSSIIERKVGTSGEESQEKIENDNVNDPEATPKANAGDEEKEADKSKEKSADAKPRRTLMPPKLRYSKYEPSLLGNRPTRIKAPSPFKRTSLAIKNQEPVMSPEDSATTEIPKLLSRMLKITNAVKENTDQSTARLLNAFKGRPSLLTSALPEKRSYNFNRMSTVVKTTLNSPARKMPRKSVLSTNAPSLRASVMGQPPAATSKLAGPRQSMLPINKIASKATANTGGDSGGSAAAAAAKEPETVRKSLYPNRMSLAKFDKTYTCSVCAAKFRIKSLLDAHKRSHETDTPVQQARPKSSLMSTSSSSACSASNSNQCKYCDKKFALLRALHIHLMQNCPKIPPGDKKKLHYTELDHVEKAQLPSHSDGATAMATQRSKIPAKTLLSSSESLTDKKVMPKTSLKFNKAAPSAAAAPGSSAKTPMPAPTSGVPVRKKTAHAGVYRTPSKNVKCHKCKMSFKSIMEHIDHNLKVHPSAAPADEKESETATNTEN